MTEGPRSSPKSRTHLQSLGATKVTLARFAMRTHNTRPTVNLIVIWSLYDRRMRTETVLYVRRVQNSTTFAENIGRPGICTMVNTTSAVISRWWLWKNWERWKNKLWRSLLTATPECASKMNIKPRKLFCGPSPNRKDHRVLTASPQRLKTSKGHTATGRGGPRGSGSVKAPDFLDVRHYKGGRSSALHTGRLYPRRNPWYSFSEAESTPGHTVPSGATEKIPSDTTWNRFREHPTSSAVPWPLRCPRPQFENKWRTQFRITYAQPRRDMLGFHTHIMTTAVVLAS